MQTYVVTVRRKDGGTEMYRYTSESAHHAGEQYFDDPLTSEPDNVASIIIHAQRDLLENRVTL